MKLPYSLVVLAALSAILVGPACTAQEVSVNNNGPGLEEKRVSNSWLTLPDAPEPSFSASVDSSKDQSASQQNPAPVNTSNPELKTVTLRGTPKRFLLDQKAIWTSPLHVRPSDAVWLLPLAATTGVMIGSDQHTMTSLIHINPNDQQHFNTFSEAGVATLGAIPAGMYLWSLGNYAPQAHETGLLAGEALADTLVVNGVVRVVSLRERPAVNNAQGHFFTSSPLDSSFPSNHAAAAWALASVVGAEYPGWITRTAVYGLAAGVSVSRVLAEQHFPSDVLIGSALGWLVGHYVYHAHHNFSLNPFNPGPMPRSYGTPRQVPPQQFPPQQSSTSVQPGASVPLQTNTYVPPAPATKRLPRLYADDVDPDTIGSTNVPMDSWVYPALERLAAMGFIPGQSSSIRPWTRQECLRQLKLAEDLASTPDGDYSPSLLAQARLMISDLHTEFETEPNYYESLSFDSVYARYGTIAGPALTDSFHFGQTWWNDFGRPLGRGSSAIAGFEMRANYGRLFFYDRQELQHGPGNPAETPEINALINVLDNLNSNDPHIQPIPQNAAYDRQRPIELYAGVAFAGNAISFGKQAMYWGPTTMGPLAFSSNAEPTYNLRFTSTRPHPFPFFPIARDLPL